ncbi:4a-hydroxytetrahydrobiopterin dehydratase [Vulcanisaeta thermophila]|uniref:4a-hydroxytetrahydrobiopterin dehydratase n=1 Tax=Vulcanisaeta thermophila TaxID=867917 RepID=UPI001EE278B0|nr:4a-hydroxytetrahydrobiopterin dehydratase [Vulcanisaeta thermophila]
MTLLKIEDVMRMLPSGWRVEGQYLIRDLEFRSFMDCIAFVNELAQLAEQEEHHPDMVIVWKHLTLRLTTHDEGGITELDLEMANKINQLIDKWGDRIEAK